MLFRTLRHMGLASSACGRNNALHICSGPVAAMDTPRPSRSAARSPEPPADQAGRGRVPAAKSCRTPGRGNRNRGPLSPKSRNDNELTRKYWQIPESRQDYTRSLLTVRAVCRPHLLGTDWAHLTAGRCLTLVRSARPKERCRYRIVPVGGSRYGCQALTFVLNRVGA